VNWKYNTIHLEFSCAPYKDINFFIEVVLVIEGKQLQNALGIEQTIQDS
jgi:hypothetical protein